MEQDIRTSMSPTIRLPNFSTAILATENLKRSGSSQEQLSAALAPSRPRWALRSETTTIQDVHLSTLQTSKTKTTTSSSTKAIGTSLKTPFHLAWLWPPCHGSNGE